MIQTGRLLQQRYRIQKQIGQGGMGAVYIATEAGSRSTRGSDLSSTKNIIEIAFARIKRSNDITQSSVRGKDSRFGAI